MRSTAKHLVMAVAVTALVVSGSGQASGARITYQLVSLDGVGLFGSITTDGTLGIIDSAVDITAWTWGLYGVTLASSTDPGAHFIAAGLVATPTELFLPPGASASWGVAEPQTGALTAIFDYGAATVPPFSPPTSTGYIGHIHGGPAWLISSPDLADAHGNFVIANAPEPSSLVLAGRAVVCGITYGLARKLRAPRKGTTEL
jgi:hypothetical protein